MGVDAVGLIKYRRDTALGIKCGALIEVALAEHANSGEICCFQGESESCSAAADNQDIEKFRMWLRSVKEQLSH
jgi:hypothetical protein